MEDRIYTGEFRVWGDVCAHFGIDESEPDMVYAFYDIDGYEGSALVLYRRGENWYEAYGSHCSCYGLEGQWLPSSFDPQVIFLEDGAHRYFRVSYSEIKNWLAERV